MPDWISNFVEATWPWFFLTCVAVSLALYVLGRYIDKRRHR